MMRTSIFLILFSFGFSMPDEHPMQSTFHKVAVTGDTNIINNTNLKIYLLFQNTGYQDTCCTFEKPLELGMRISENDNITINTGGRTIMIYKDSCTFNTLELPDGPVYLEVKTFATHRNVNEQKNGGFEISFDTAATRFKTSMGKITVNPTSRGCDDTGENPFELSYKGKMILFKMIENLTIFSYDVDKDGINELYVINYASCMGRMKIYRIDTK